MPPRPKPMPVEVRPSTPADFDAVIEMCRLHYPDEVPWDRRYLQMHLDRFPEGQLVAVDSGSGRVVGSAATLIIRWGDYDLNHTWQEVTGRGSFDTHDPEHGRTLYGADVMVHPDAQGRGVGKAIYAARRALCRRLALPRIRAGARLAGYHRFAGTLTAAQYVQQVIRGDLADPTLTFQVRRGFRVIGVVEHYLRHDPRSHGHAAVIEWLNHQVDQPREAHRRDPRFAKPRPGR